MFSSYAFVDEQFLDLVKLSTDPCAFRPSCFAPLVDVSSAIFDVIQCAQNARFTNMERHTTMPLGYPLQTSSNVFKWSLPELIALCEEQIHVFAQLQEGYFASNMIKYHSNVLAAICLQHSILFCEDTADQQEKDWE